MSIPESEIQKACEHIHSWLVNASQMHHMFDGAPPIVVWAYSDGHKRFLINSWIHRNKTIEIVFKCVDELHGKTGACDPWFFKTLWDKTDFDTVLESIDKAVRRSFHNLERDFQ